MIVTVDRTEHQRYHTNFYILCFRAKLKSKKRISDVASTPNRKGSGEPQDTEFKIIINVSNPKIERERIANILL